MPKNSGLSEAKKAKKDEFYTQLYDIEEEMKHYRKHFQDKVVFCNCDDPFESNFFKYFVLNFNRLKLKKLIATCYATSTIAWQQMNLFDVGEADNPLTKTPYKAVVTKVYDTTGTGLSMADIKALFVNKENKLTKLKGDGDFRSDECVKLLQEADIVVTNPPFSLFRDYVAQLFDYNKKFIILGNGNSIILKDFFPYIKENKVWFGPSIYSGDRAFYVPDDYPLDASTCGIDDTGRRFIRVKGVRWFTNLDHKKRHEDIVCVKKFTSEQYPQYDNYEAIEVGQSKDIPLDYRGVMGVPITFMDKFCPEQFEIIWQASGNSYANAPKELMEKLKFDPTVKYGGGLGTCVLNGKAKYSRLLIRYTQQWIADHPEDFEEA